MASLDDALAAMRAEGLQIESLDTSGQIVRVAVDTDKGTKRSGWYVCHLHTSDRGDPVYLGAFGNHKTGTGTLKLTFDASTESERQRLREESQRARELSEREVAQKAEEAAKRAAEIWSKLPAEGGSAYLSRKRIQGYGVRFARGGAIVVPMHSARGRLRGLQFIGGDGTKRMLTGCRKQGSLFWLDGREPEPGGICYLAEGFATAAAVYACTAKPTASVT